MTFPVHRPAPLKLKDRLWAYIELTRLNKPIGSFLLLWPTLWALWIAAQGVPALFILSVFVIGTVLMRSAGCAINDWADRDIDPFVRRTFHRPLASKRIEPNEALMVFAVLAVAAFVLVLQLNALTIGMSVVALLLAGSYPFMKRYHYLPQVHLGIAFAWAIPMAYTALTGEMPRTSGWLLFIATVLWTTAYDTMYAMVDREDDVKIGVKSSAILFGENDKSIIGILQLMMLCSLLLVGHEESLGWIFHTSLVVAGFYGLYQQFLIRDREPQECFRAFLNNNYLGMVIFLGIVAEYHFYPPVAG